MGAGAARRLTCAAKLPDPIWRLHAHDLNMLMGLYVLLARVLRVKPGAKSLKSGTAIAAQVFTIAPAVRARKSFQWAMKCGFRENLQSPEMAGRLCFPRSPCQS